MERKKRIYCTLGGFLTGVLTTCLIWAYVGRIPAGHTGDVRADDSADRPGQASDMSVLPESSASPGENTGSSVPQSPVDTWDSAAVYTGGDTVSYQGRRYRAKWWTQGEKPDSSDVWKDLGILDGKAIQPEGIKNIPIDASEPKDTALTDFKVVGYYPSWKPDKLQSVDFGSPMRMIIAPAKKMVVDTDSFAVDDLPQFLEQTERLKAVLQTMSPKELQGLWKCNDAIARLNVERLARMDLRRNLTPVIIAYEGIQYRYMAPGVMKTSHLDYLREHLRILSGFYGLLRPFDGVTPYRLEMQAKLEVDGCRDLYQFWGDRLARQLAAETDLVLNLASKEYSKAAELHLPESVRFLTCTFGEWKDGKIIEKGTQCKMARGQMVRWMAEHKIEDPEDLRAFDQLDYRFHGELSTENQYVFLTAPSHRARF